MITVESKLDLFNKVVLEKIKKEQKELENVLEEKKIKALKEQEKVSTKKADLFLRAIIDEAYEDKKTLLAKAKSERKHRVLSERQDLINQLAEAVLNRFEQFVAESGYVRYIDQIVNTYQEDLKDFGRFTLVVNKKHFERDVAFFKEAFEAMPIKPDTYEPSQVNIVGGGIFFNEERNVLIDATLVSLLEEHRKEIGQRMYIMLNEVGDAYDK
jgi:vacuolar-type H+-ATPase subunit E/Vma4